LEIDKFFLIPDILEGNEVFQCPLSWSGLEFFNPRCIGGGGSIFNPLSLEENEVFLIPVIFKGSGVF